MSNEQLRQIKQYFDGAIFNDVRARVIANLDNYNPKDAHQGLGGEQFVLNDEDLKQM